MVSVVPLVPFSVSAACDPVSSLSVEDFFLRFPVGFPCPTSCLFFRFWLIHCGGCEALWRTSLSPPFCVIALIGHVHSPVEIFSFSKNFLLAGTDVPSSSRLD